jgi:outer membrane protein assembly factor BamB
MFHVKRHSAFGLLLLFGLATLLASACSGAAGARGWSGAVQQPGTTVVSSGAGRLVGLDGSGRVLWRFPDFWQIPDGSAENLDGIYGEPVFSQDGSTVFVGDYNGHVYAFKPGDYREGVTQESVLAASWKLEGSVIGGLLLNEATDTLYVTSDNRVFSLRASDLQQRIINRDFPVRQEVFFEAGDEIWSTPVLEDGKLLFASLDGNLYAVDPASRRELWRFGADSGLVSTPAVAGDVVLVAGFGSTVYGVDIDSGSEEWSFKARNWIWGRPVIDGARAFVADFDGMVHAVNLSDGAPAWSLNVGRGALRASPALVDGTLVVSSDDGWLVGVNTSGQSTRWETRVGTAMNADIVADGNQALISPNRCVTPAEGGERIYYFRVDPANGNLTGSRDVC